MDSPTPMFSVPAERPPPHFESLSDQAKAKIAEQYIANNFEKKDLDRIAEAPGATKVKEEIPEPTAVKASARRTKNPN